jgi:hypothetical protein
MPFALATVDVSMTLPGIPLYRYFYSCSSGVVDCVNFDRNQNYYGDFGMNGLVPTNWGNGPASFHVDMSNKRGEVIGRVNAINADSMAYGLNGVVMCVAGGCRDMADHPVALNDNGLFLFYSGYGPSCAYIGYGFNEIAELGPSTMGVGTSCGLADVLHLSNFQFGEIRGVGTLGINNDNQILANILTEQGPVQGVLSPSAVPEPTTLALLTTVLVGTAWKLRSRVGVSDRS